MGLARGAEFSRTEDVVYGRKDGMALTLDVFRPLAGARGVGVVLIVSGGWASSHAAISLKFVEPYLERGLTVFAVVHSSQPRYLISDIIPDVHRAVRFIRTGAGGYGIDPDKIGVTGASAGGHLSLMLGTQGGPGDPAAADPVDRASSAVQAVAVFFPPTDFNNYVKPGVDALDESVLKNFRKFIGPIPEDIAQRDALGRQLSPIYAITPALPPTLLIHGDKDPLVLLHQSERFRDAAVAAGAVAELIVKPGAGHGWPEMRPDVQTCAAWFVKYLAPPVAAPGVPAPP